MRGLLELFTAAIVSQVARVCTTTTERWIRNGEAARFMLRMAVRMHPPQARDRVFDRFWDHYIAWCHDDQRGSSDSPLQRYLELRRLNGAILSLEAAQLRQGVLCHSVSVVLLAPFASCVFLMSICLVAASLLEGPFASEANSWAAQNPDRAQWMLDSLQMYGSWIVVVLGLVIPVVLALVSVRSAITELLHPPQGQARWTRLAPVMALSFVNSALIAAFFAFVALGALIAAGVQASTISPRAFLALTGSIALFVGGLSALAVWRLRDHAHGDAAAVEV